MLCRYGTNRQTETICSIARFAMISLRLESNRQRGRQRITGHAIRSDHRDRLHLCDRQPASRIDNVGAPSALALIVALVVARSRHRAIEQADNGQKAVIAPGMTDADLLDIILRIGSGTYREGVPGKNAYETTLSSLRDFRVLPVCIP